MYQAISFLLHMRRMETAKGRNIQKMKEDRYQFSSHQHHDGIKMDITISTDRDMAMSELLAGYAALSHGVYLEMARDINERKR